MKKVFNIFLIIIISIIVIIGIVFIIVRNGKENKLDGTDEYNLIDLNMNNEITNVILNEKVKKEITDWRLVLVNFENDLPNDFKVELSNIDSIRQFDSRAIEYLIQMQKQMKKDGVRDGWVQSAYRSIEYQQELYEQKVQEYMKLGMSREIAEEKTSQSINKPEASEHNLGLAVDFNYVDMTFEKTKAFKWLLKNAEEYGFILRYKKEKEDITKVNYEPWHWRFVGKEHAVVMNDLDMCLEEYIEYLKENSI